MTVAKYLRISYEDDDLNEDKKRESNSITNQRNLLDAYISRAPEFTGAEVLEFCDDGWSGKNFARPAVNKMIAQARRGELQCIVVKDLSRFGRDHLTVDYYICRVFPFLGVRFIAVNDDFDSLRPGDIDSLETSFKTLLYDLYSRDLSRKVRSAQEFRARHGDFLSAFAPYGYYKDPARKGRLMVDPPAAEIVRRIFRLASEGHSREQIARVLNREAAPPPMLHKREAGCSRTSWPSLHGENFWTGRTVAGILKDLRYTGANVFGKRTRDQVGRAHTAAVWQAEWVIVEGTHEAIVSREEFDRVQARTVVKRRTASHGGPLSGKVRCGVCGHMMAKSVIKSPIFYCRTSRVTDNYGCTEERFSEKDLLDIVMECLRHQAAAVAEPRRLEEEWKRQKAQTAAGLRRELSELKAGQIRRERQAQERYEALIAGKIGRETYLAGRSVAAKEKEEASSRIAALEASLEGAEMEKCECRELTPEIVEEVLKCVCIYPGGRFEIVWKFRDEYGRALEP